MAANSSFEQLLSDMVYELKEVDWHTLGTHLLVPQHKLNTIKQDTTSPDRKLTEMLHYCLKNNGDMNWKKIIQALERIGCHANIIIIIEAKYITTGQHQSQAKSFDCDISAPSNTTLTTSDAGAISAGTESEQAFCRVTGNEQVVAKRMEDIRIDQKSSNLDGTKEVEISGERYILGVAPAANSGVVAEAKKKLLGRVDLKTLVDDLGHTGSFIRVAYNGVMAAGPRYTKLQIEIQDLGFDVTNLCNESALTVCKFETASATVLTDLEIIYDLILCSKETVATEILSTTSTLAEKMKDAANTLQDKFKKEEVKVKNTLEKVQIARGEEAIRIKQKEEEHQQLEIQLKHQQKLLDDAQRLEQEAEAQRWQIEAKENEAISGMKHIGPIVNAMFGYEVFDEGTKKLDRWREKRIQVLENERKLRKERYEAMETLTTFAVKLQNCQSEQEMADVTEDALHKTIGVLKQLIYVFKRAATFWRRMQDQCRSLADDRMKAEVTSISSSFTKEERMTMWTSEKFKKEAVHFHARWVALNNLCSEYSELIHKTQTDLYEHMAENPTYEESRKNVQVLAKEFLTYLRKRREIMAQRNSKDQEEINGLASKQD